MRLTDAEYIPTHTEAKMEECPPGGGYASGEDNLSESDNPPVSWITNPGGEQGQSKSERSQLGTCLLCF